MCDLEMLLTYICYNGSQHWVYKCMTCTLKNRESDQHVYIKALKNIQKLYTAVYFGFYWSSANQHSVVLKNQEDGGNNIQILDDGNRKSCQLTWTFRSPDGQTNIDTTFNSWKFFFRRFTLLILNSSLYSLVNIRVLDPNLVIYSKMNYTFWYMMQLMFVLFQPWL